MIKFLWRVIDFSINSARTELLRNRLCGCTHFLIRQSNQYLRGRRRKGGLRRHLSTDVVRIDFHGGSLFKRLMGLSG